MAQVVWTFQAITDLATIGEYVAELRPLAAQRLSVRLKAAADGLAELPERGRAIGRGRRELATGPPYLIRYRIKSGLVEILTIRHGARAPD